LLTKEESSLNLVILKRLEFLEISRMNLKTFRRKSLIKVKLLLESPLLTGSLRNRDKRKRVMLEELKIRLLNTRIRLKTARMKFKRWNRRETLLKEKRSLLREKESRWKMSSLLRRRRKKR